MDGFVSKRYGTGIQSTSCRGYGTVHQPQFSILSYCHIHFVPVTFQSSMTSEPQLLKADGIAVSLTDMPLDIPSVISEVKSPKAGAIVLFAGFLTTIEFFLM